MRNIFGAAVVLISLVAGTFSATAECLCGEEGFFYTTANPDDVDWMETFPWEVVSIEPIFDMEQPGEPIVSCDIKVNLVAGDHPALETLEINDAGEEPIFFNGSWVTFSAFEKVHRPSCVAPIS